METYRTEAIRIEQEMTQDGEVVLRNLPYKKGQRLEVIVVPWAKSSPSPLTVGRFRQSGLIGLWKDRSDIKDSSVYARQLREQAQQRESNDVTPR